MADVDDLLGTVEGEPLSLRYAERSVTYLWGAYWSGKYDALTGLIPQALTGLRCTLHAADPAERPRAAEYVAQGYELAGSTLTHLRQPDAAFIAIRRAVDLAGESDDPLLAAVLKGSVAWQLMVGGRFDDAERVATRTAQDIEPSGEVGMPHLSAYGSLLVSAATAAGRANRITEAQEGSASPVRSLGGSVPTGPTTRGPSAPPRSPCRPVDVGVVTEDYPAALHAARAMPPDPGLPLAARCRHLADRAYAHSKLGQQDQALTLLLTAERMSPDWIRHQTLVRSITATCWRPERPARHHWGPRPADRRPPRLIGHRVGRGVLPRQS